MGRSQEVLAYCTDKSAHMSSPTGIQRMALGRRCLVGHRGCDIVGSRDRLLEGHSKRWIPDT